MGPNAPIGQKMTYIWGFVDRHFSKARDRVFHVWVRSRGHSDW